MKPFDPGWSPSCFVPGEPLRFVRARGTGFIAGVIEQEMPDILRDPSCITVPDRDMQRAMAWLAAWNKG